MPIHKEVNINFFKKWTKEMSYVLGFFAADGYITTNKRGGKFWCIQITDQKLLNSIKKVINSNHKIGTRIPKKSGENIIYRLQIGSIEMCKDLNRLGFTEKKAKNLAIPDIPKNYFADFIRGYFDGDGNIWQGEVHKNRKTSHIVLQLAFTSCSYKFLKSIHDRFLEIGLKGGCIYSSKKKEFHRLQLSTGDALKLYKFMYNRDVGDFKGLYLKRKKKIFDNYIHLRL